MNNNTEQDLEVKPPSVSMQDLKKLSKVINKAICKITSGEGNRIGTGFFCNVMLEEWNQSRLRVLITNSHLLNPDDIERGKKLTLSTNNDEENYEIEIDNDRETYTSDKYELTIIEIKKDDKIKGDSFLDIDEHIFDPNYNLKDKQIILLHYPQGNEENISYGSIKNIGKNGYEIEHLCSSDYGSSGGPLINATDFKVIAIHKGASINHNYNYGTLLKDPIIEFKKIFDNKENKKDNKNEKNEDYVNEIIDKNKEENND